MNSGLKGPQTNVGAGASAMKPPLRGEEGLADTSNKSPAPATTTQHHTMTLEYALYPKGSEVTSCFCSCDWTPDYNGRTALLIEECAAQFSRHVGTVGS